MATLRCYTRGFISHSGSKLAIFNTESENNKISKIEIQLQSVKEVDKNKQTSLPSKDQEKQTSSSTKDQEKQTSSSTKDQEKQTSSPSKDQEKQTSSPSKDQEKQTSSPSKDQEKQTSSPSKDQEKQTSSPSKDESQGGENSKEQNAEKPEESGEASTLNQNRALASTLSPSGKYFAVCDDEKQLHVFGVEKSWELLNRRILPKRGTALAFTQNEDKVIVTDKTGDVYQCSVNDNGSECKLLLGHLSMLLDVCLTKDDRFIVTSDRDEKIRISHYPNCYNIHTYCLGHTEYVTSLVYVEDKDLLISGGGDGQIMVWTLQGQRQARVTYSPSLQQLGQSSEGQEQNIVAVKKLVYNSDLCLLTAIYFGSNQADVYRLLTEASSSTCLLLHVTTLTLQEEPWDVCFDSHQRLWILQPKEGETILTYKCWQEDSEDHIQAIDKSQMDPRTSSFVHSVNSDWEFFKASQNVDIFGLSQGLKKVKVDNMKEYLEKKQERMNKKKDTTEIKQQPPEKKQKIS